MLGDAIRRRALWVPAAVGVATFAVAYDDGGYSLASRSTIAIVVWWAIIVAVGLRVWPVEHVPRGAVVVGVLLALFAGWDLASTAWAASAERAFSEFDRTALYLGVYVLSVAVAREGCLERWIDGLTAAIAAVGSVALVSRFFPGSFPGRGVPALLPSSSTRLSFPLDYWNGLGIFVGLAFPLLLHWALAGSRPRRIAAFAILPALGTVVYLTSSRGAAVALAGGVLVFILVQPRRFTALGAAAAAAAGTAAAVAVVAPRRALVDGPLASAAARAEGHRAAVFVLLACALTAVVAEAAVVVASRLPAPGRVLRRVCAVAIVLVVGGAGAYQARELRDFARLPPVAASSVQGNAVSDHLLSGSGSGRWQFWAAALDELRSAPLEGRGAGSFEAWWAQHASFPYFVVDAHSLFFQTLGELGIVGFLLLTGTLGTGVVVAIRRLRRASGNERAAVAALLGALTAYVIGAGVDWMWELTAVTVVGVGVLGLLTGPATTGPATVPGNESGRTRPRPLSVIGLVALGGAIVVAEAIALLAGVEVGASQAEVRSGGLLSARAHALAATRIEPWAASAYLQLALVDQRAGELAGAKTEAVAAIRHDGDDWRPWLVLSQIESRLGEPAAAAFSLARARSLDPRSPIFAQGTS